MDKFNSDLDLLEICQKISDLIYKNEFNQIPFRCTTKSINREN